MKSYKEIEWHLQTLYMNIQALSYKITDKSNATGSIYYKQLLNIWLFCIFYFLITTFYHLHALFTMHINLCQSTFIWVNIMHVKMEIFYVCN